MSVVGVLLTFLMTVILVTAGCAPQPAPSPSALVAVPAWEGKLVRKPGDTPDDSKVYLVKDGKRHWIVNADWLKANGFRWPDDVHTIRAADLDAIPQGEPLQ